MLAEFLQFLFSGITVGATYALAALGFTLIYNASNVINFAQGEFIMLGGMLAVYFTQAVGPCQRRWCWRLFCQRLWVWWWKSWRSSRSRGPSRSR